ADHSEMSQRVVELPLNDRFDVADVYPARSGERSEAAHEVAADGAQDVFESRDAIVRRVELYRHPHVELVAPDERPGPVVVRRGNPNGPGKAGHLGDFMTIFGGVRHEA